MYIFPSGFGLAMTFVREKEKSTHPNTRTQPARVFYKSRDQESGDAWCFSIRISLCRLSLSSQNKTILTHEHSRSGDCPSSGVGFSRRHAFCWACRNRSPGAHSLVCLRSPQQRKQNGWPCHSGIHDEAATLADVRMLAGPARETLLREVELISHFMHTHTPASHI